MPFSKMRKQRRDCFRLGVRPEEKRDRSSSYPFPSFILRPAVDREESRGGRLLLQSYCFSAQQDSKATPYYRRLFSSGRVRIVSRFWGAPLAVLTWPRVSVSALPVSCFRSRLPLMRRYDPRHPDRCLRDARARYGRRNTNSRAGSRGVHTTDRLKQPPLPCALRSPFLFSTVVHSTERKM